MIRYCPIGMNGGGKMIPKDMEPIDRIILLLDELHELLPELQVEQILSKAVGMSDFSRMGDNILEPRLIALCTYYNT